MSEVIECRTMQGVRMWFNRKGLNADDAHRLAFRTKNGFAFYKAELIELAKQRENERQAQELRNFMLLLNFHQILARVNHV